VLVVPDTAQDSRFSHNPLVTNEPYVRFYAGAPIITSDGFTVGTLCVLDTVPRDVGTMDFLPLVHFAQLARDVMEHRDSGAKAALQIRTYREKKDHL